MVCISEVVYGCSFPLYANVPSDLVRLPSVSMYEGGERSESISAQSIMLMSPVSMVMRFIGTAYCLMKFIVPSALRFG